MVYRSTIKGQPRRLYEWVVRLLNPDVEHDDYVASPSRRVSSERRMISNDQLVPILQKDSRYQSRKYA